MITDHLRPIRRPTHTIPAKRKRLAVRVARSTNTKTAAWLFAVTPSAVNRWRRSCDDPAANGRAPVPDPF